MYRIDYRPAETVEDGWQSIAVVRTLAEASDELASWTGPSQPRLGDIASVGVVGRPREMKRLYVYRGDRFVLVNDGARMVLGWDGLWSGSSMLAESKGVSRPRLAVAAYACARTCVGYLPQRPFADLGYAGPQGALEVALGWAAGDVDRDEAVAALADARLAHAALRRDRPLQQLQELAAASHALIYALRVCSDAEPSAAASEAAWYATTARQEAGDPSAHLASIVRPVINLSVVACARVGAPDPVQFNARQLARQR